MPQSDRLNPLHRADSVIAGSILLRDVADGVATLTLNRPDKLNALNYALIDALMEQLDRIELDAAIGVVIITGAGNRAFSAGADIAEFSESIRQGAAVAVHDFVRRGQALTARLENYPKLIIAAINGIAFGGGCEITEAVHLSIASEQAIFAKPEIKLGMPPTFGGTQRLARLAGRKRALHLLLTGESFTPADALAMGLINRIVPAAQLLPSARDLARSLSRQGPAVTAGILQAVTRGLNMTIGEGLLVESEQFAKLVPGRELHAGLDAWLARRGGSGTRTT